MLGDEPGWEALIRPGLGQLTRPFGTAPVDPVLVELRFGRSSEDVVAAVEEVRG
jgi:beta-xylosidase